MIKKTIIKILKKFGYKISKINTNKILSVVEADENIKSLILKSSKFSMTGELRMFILSNAIKFVKDNNLQGDFVECGV
jgi:hypothetical protein